MVKVLVDNKEYASMKEASRDAFQRFGEHWSDTALCNRINYKDFEWWDLDGYHHWGRAGRGEYKGHEIKTPNYDEVLAHYNEYQEREKREKEERENYIHTQHELCDKNGLGLLAKNVEELNETLKDIYHVLYSIRGSIPIPECVDYEGLILPSIEDEETLKRIPEDAIMSFRIDGAYVSGWIDDNDEPNRNFTYAYIDESLSARKEKYSLWVGVDGGIGQHMASGFYVDGKKVNAQGFCEYIEDEMRYW